MINNKKLAVIHIAKAQVGMSEDEYRAMLGGVDVSSAKDLNNKTFSTIMKQFEQLGFKSKSKTRKGSRRPSISNLPRSKRELMKKLEALILDQGKSWAYVDSIAKKRLGVDKAQWLTADKLRKLVIMMQYQSNREKKKQSKAQQSGYVPMTMHKGGR